MITSPAITVGVNDFFGALRPTLERLGRLGAFDFTDDATGIAGHDGRCPVPLALAATKENYGSSGSTVKWIPAEVETFIYGGSLGGVDLDKGADAAKVRNRFATGAARQLGLELLYCAEGAMNSIEANKEAVGYDTTTARGWMAAFASVAPADVGFALVFNRKFWPEVIDAFAHANIVRREDIAQALGAESIEVMDLGDAVTAVCLPRGSFGVMARVPAKAADYAEEGVITDETTGLSVGLSVANDETHNCKAINADAWLAAWVLDKDAAELYGYDFGAYKVFVPAE